MNLFLITISSIFCLAAINTKAEITITTEPKISYNRVFDLTQMYESLMPNVPREHIDCQLITPMHDSFLEYITYAHINLTQAMPTQAMHEASSENKYVLYCLLCNGDEFNRLLNDLILVTNKAQKKQMIHDFGVRQYHYMRNETITHRNLTNPLEILPTDKLFPVPLFQSEMLSSLTNAKAEDTITKMVETFTTPEHLLRYVQFASMALCASFFDIL